MTFKDFVDRYGVSLGVVFALAMLIAVLPGNAPERSGLRAGSGASGEFDPITGEPIDGGFDGSGAGGFEGGGGSTTGGRRGAGGAGGIGGGGTGAVPGGGAVKFGVGPDCDANGRQKGISGYVPPCVEWVKGTPNGGATARGVTANQIKIVSWLGKEDPNTRAALTSARLNDEPAKVKRAYDALFKYNNQHYQTYGREVIFEEVNASGESYQDEAMVADAVKIAEEKKAFAVFAGNALAPIPTRLARELAQRGVICICTTSLSSEFYNELPATIFSSLPTINEYLVNAAEYAAKKLGYDKAAHAGLELSQRNRKYCMYYVTGTKQKVDPEGPRMRDIAIKEFAKRGITFEEGMVRAYLYDPGNPEPIATDISAFNGGKCTTIIPLVDPIQPILITREATRQGWFPEWLLVGTGLSDTTTIARFYDQEQWRHAFGISPLWVTWSRVEVSAGYREFHHGMPGMAKGDEGVLINIYRAGVQSLFRGIHMAGPILNNETFAAGMFAYPSTGGKPASPTVWLSRQYPTEIKDWSEIWYDPTLVGPDERSDTGQGMIVRADGGRRYKAGEWQVGPPSRNNPVTTTDEQNNPPHEQDGHKHNTKCLSC